MGVRTSQAQPDPWTATAFADKAVCRFANDPKSFVMAFIRSPRDECRHCKIKEEWIRYSDVPSGWAEPPGQRLVQKIE